MAGVKGRSGRKPETVDAKQIRAMAYPHGRTAMNNVIASVKAGNMEDSKYLLGLLLPRLPAEIDIGVKEATTLVELLKQSFEAAPADTPADSMAAMDKPCTDRSRGYPWEHEC